MSQSDAFRFHRDHADAGLRISGPILESGREPYIAVSRRLVAADGGFAGVVVGTLRLSYFRELFQKIRLSPAARCRSCHTDGALIARVPDSAYEVGRDLRRSDTFERALIAPAGVSSHGGGRWRPASLCLPQGRRLSAADLGRHGGR